MIYDIDNIKLGGDVKSFCMQLKAISIPTFNMDRLIREKVNKETENLNNRKYQLNLTDITLHPTTAECTFFSIAQGTFSMMDQMLGHKTSLNTFKKTEIIPRIFSDHSGIELEINSRSKTQKSTTCRN